jgi:hypothetical protein
VGAVNVTAVPELTAAFVESDPHEVEFSAQVTPPFFESPVTVAASDCVDPSFTLTDEVDGVVTATTIGFTVTPIVAVFVVSVRSVTVTVAAQEEFTDATGVNVTDDVLLPVTAVPSEPQVLGLTLQERFAPASES